MRLQAEHSGGRLINVTGDGTFSLFDGPTHAVRCADEIRKSAEELGISVRAGVHAGELERTGRDLTGLSVHVGARVGAMAMPNEVLVSRTVRDLGGGLWARVRRPAFAHAEGVPGRWHVYALAAADQPMVLPIERSLETPFDHVALRSARTAPRAVRAALRAGNALQRYRARGGQIASRAAERH